MQSLIQKLLVEH